MLRSEPATGLPDWSLRGELLMMLDRLRTELQVEHRARAQDRWPHRGSARRRRPRWLPRHQRGRPRPHKPPG